jgi:hypothetical protein
MLSEMQSAFLTHGSGTAANLAERDAIGVFPVGGWWKGETLPRPVAVIVANNPAAKQWMCS